MLNKNAELVRIKTTEISELGGRFKTIYSNGNRIPLQCSSLENPMDGGAWWATVHGIAETQARLSDCAFFSFSLWSSLS